MLAGPGFSERRQLQRWLEQQVDGNRSNRANHASMAASIFATTPEASLCLALTPDDRLAGAACWHPRLHRGEQVCYLAWMGSLGNLAGTGSALLVAAAQDAMWTPPLLLETETKSASRFFHSCGLKVIRQIGPPPPPKPPLLFEGADEWLGEVYQIAAPEPEPLRLDLLQEGTAVSL